MNHKIENTSTTDPLIHLGEAMSNPNGFIERMEERGQAQLVSSTTLPTNIGYNATTADYEALGFTFGPVVEGDPLFREAALPPGWTKERTDHSMWSVIKDERGIERVAIFYKAAFYDRAAHMNINDVGAGFFTNWVYGDITPDVDPRFTKEELEQTLAEAQQMRVRIGEEKSYGSVYAKHLPRVESLEAAVKARLEELNG